MLQETRKYARFVFAGLNILAIIAMLVVGYAGCTNPADHPYFSVIGLSFPVFIVCNLVFFIIWPFLDKRFLLLPVIGIMLNYDLLMDYTPLSIPSEHPEGSIKVLSYNTLGFNYSGSLNEDYNEILQYIIDSKADIICIQEWTGNKGGKKKQWDEIDKLYPYCETLRAIGPDGKELAGGDEIAVLSKFPITGKQNLPIESKGNVAGVFTLDIKGKPIEVINVHLETVGFSMEDKIGFRNMVKGNKDEEEMEKESKTLISKLAASSKVRAVQAEVIADYVKKHEGESIILCGDFNDHPLSYTHRTIDQGLTDCYRKTGNLPGFTHHKSAMYVRIDNIMCSSDWQPYECQVDKAVKLSDHYPIFCYFKQK